MCGGTENKYLNGEAILKLKHKQEITKAACCRLPLATTINKLAPLVGQQLLTKLAGRRPCSECGM